MVEKATYAAFKIGAILVSLCEELQGEMVEERECPMHRWRALEWTDFRGVDGVTRGIGCPSRRRLEGIKVPVEELDLMTSDSASDRTLSEYGVEIQNYF